MPAPQRNTQPGVMDRLLSEPHRFEFFQAVLLIESWLNQNGIEDGAVPLALLRFENHLSLAFPASQIAALRVEADVPITSASDLRAAIHGRQLRYISMTPAFMGFLGANGGLPFHYTERIARHADVTKDAGPQAFLDMLSTRSISMFYQAWTKHRPECMADAGGDHFLTMLRSISGVGAPARAQPNTATPIDTGGPGDELIAFYAAQFRNRRVPASVIAGVMSEYFQVPFMLRQLAGCWDELPDRHQARLGVANDTLGAGAVLGRRIYRHDARAILSIGSLGKDAFADFLPRGTGAHAIDKILGMFCGTGMTFEVQLVLRAQDIGQGRLQSQCAQGHAGLGYNVFLNNKPAQTDRIAARYVIQP